MKKKGILIGIVLILLVIVIRVSYAYFEAQNNGPTSKEVIVDTGTVDTLSFFVDKDISVVATQDNLTRNGENVSDTSTLTATLTPNNTSGNATDKYNLFFVMDQNDLIYTSEEELPELVIRVTDPNGNIVERIANLDGDDGVFDITGKRKAITITTDYQISAINNTPTNQNWTVEVSIVNLNSNQAGNAGRKVTGSLILTKEVLSVYSLPEINNVETIDEYGESTITNNSIGIKTILNENTEEIDKYYYAIEEYQEPTGLVNNGIVRLSNIVRLAITENDYDEDTSDEYIFTNLNANTKYKVYVYAKDVLGFQSNIYTTILETGDVITPRISGAEISATLDSLTIDITALDGDNEIDKYLYSIDGGKTWIEEENPYIVTDLPATREYDVKVKVVDTEGLESPEYYEQITTKTYIKPEIENVNVTKNANSITINVISEEGSYEIDHYLYSIDDGNTWEEGTSSKTFSGLTGGETYNFKIKAVDENGRESVIYNLSTKAESYSLPSISDVYVRPFPTTMTINVTAAGGTNPIAKYYYSIQDGRYYVESTSSSYTFEDLASNATYYIKVYVEDSSGNISPLYETISKTDYLNPSIRGVYKQENATSVVLTVNGKRGSNEIDGYYYKLSSSNEWIASSSNAITVTGLRSNTAYTFDVKTVDTEGHESEVYTLAVHTLYVDPTVVCSAEAVDYENILVTATVYVGSNPITGYNFKKGSEAYKGIQQENNYTFGLLEPGTQYSFSVQVTDSEGHTATNTCRGTTNAAPTPTVTFNTDGGSSITSKSVTYKQTYGELTSPTKDGYQFDGWYKEATFNTLITSSTIVTNPNNHSLYAKWIPNRYTIVFNKNNTNVTGTTASLTNVSYEDNVTLTTNGYSLTGYSYQGWATTSGGDKTYNDGQTNVSVATLAAGANVTNTNNGTINLYAVWNANTYTITLNSCSATNSPSASATATYYATTLSAITVPTRSYSVSGFTITNNNASGATVSSTTALTSTYTFGGWFTGSCASPGTQVASNAATPALLASVSGYTDSSKRWTKDGAATLYAKWTGGSVTLPTITKTGYTCGWTTTSSGATTITYASGASFTPTANTTLYGVCVPKTYTVTLNKCSATNTPSASATATYYATTLSAITRPTRSYSVSGFTITNNNASGATVSSTTALTSTYTFGGWFTGSCASPGTQVASNAATPALLASVSGYTDSSKRWTKDGTATLYAKWTGGSVTLPTITKTGYTCGWTTTSSGATTIAYASGASFTPTANTTLYGVCVIKSNLSLTINFAGTGVSSVAVKSGSASGTTVGTVSTTGGTVTGLTYNTAYYLVPTYSTGYTLNKWAKDSGSVGTLSSTSAANPSFTIGDGTNSVTLTGKAKTYTVTLNKCSATNTPSSSATATYYATTLSAITRPTRSYSVSGFTITNNNASGATVSSTTALTSTYTFGGWYTGSCASPTTQVASNAATPALLASVSGYTDSSKRWTKDGAATLYAKWTGGSVTLPTITKTGYTCGWTTTSSGATSITYASGASITPTANTTLYGVCVAKKYTVTLNSCSATNTPSSSATATYYATTLSAITRPTRSYSVSGFTIPTGNNAGSATVSSTTALTSTYTFGGWYTGSCASPTTQVASNAATPALLASVSGYTDSSKRWTKDGTATLYAKWTGGSVTLPTITKTGYTCGWTTTSTGATSVTYASGASFTPTANTTLYGVCIANSYSIKFTFDSGISKINVRVLDNPLCLPSCTYTTVATVTTSGGTASLKFGTKYNLSPEVNFGNDFGTASISTGSGTLSGLDYTPGNGTATIAMTSSANWSLNTHNSSLTGGASDGSVRYSGKEPTNYVCFGSTASTCPSTNLYRIIGQIPVTLSNGTTTQTLYKIIKNDYLTASDLGLTSKGNASITTSTFYVPSSNIVSGNVATFNWNTKSTIGGNTWSESVLYTALNSTYINSLGSTWSNKIENVMWKVGGNTSAKLISAASSKITYDNEITNPVTTTTSDGVSQLANKIGLLYISDYLYASPQAAWSLASNSNPGTSNSSYHGQNWLVRGVPEWTITRISGNHYNTAYINNMGVLSNGTVNGSPYAVRPVFYLKSSVTITKTGHAGSPSDPYRIS